jgi:glycosyltransferase involved in cell wall biosynthesis
MLSEYLSIVIPCKNEEGYIQQTLLSINEQFDIDGVSVYVMDGDSLDATVQIVKELKRIVKYKLYIESGGKVGVARNNGCNLVNTPYVLFLDADTPLLHNRICYDGVTKLLEGYDLVTCKLQCTSNNIPCQIAFGLFNLVHQLLPTPFAPGAFFLTKVDKFTELGGFDENIIQSEDFILSKQYDKSKFIILDHFVGQDERRFTDMGYITFIKLLTINYINRDNKQYFYKAYRNYWRRYEEN